MPNGATLIVVRKGWVRLKAESKSEWRTILD